jgi:hypothetical protein
MLRLLLEDAHFETKQSNEGDPEAEQAEQGEQAGENSGFP